jgi:3',5'-cyclic AMP phosphodiesterase CpdA
MMKASIAAYLKVERVRLAHLSDLHFGADEPGAVAGLIADLAAQRPDLVVVSGDLTMRARRAQFVAARQLLDALHVPWLSVPGNHDLPLDRVGTRLLRPLAGYRRHIDSDPEPLRTYDGVLVLGLSSPRRYLWKGGRIDRRQTARIGSAFAEAAGVRLKVLVLHHPVFTSPQRPEEPPVRGSRRALLAAAEAGVDVVLCGHDHVQAHADLSLPGGHLLAVMCGTTTSHRVRADESQSYNLLDLDDDRRLTLSVRQWRDGAFAPLLSETWRLQ